MLNKYGFGKAVPYAFDEALKRVTLALQEEGFGIVSDIDMAATMQRHLNAAMPPYRVLGACNAVLAQRAMQIEPAIGLLLPCNVAVREDAAGHVHVECQDPELMLQAIGKPEVMDLAHDARQRLQRVMHAI